MQPERGINTGGAGVNHTVHIQTDSSNPYVGQQLSYQSHHTSNAPQLRSNVIKYIYSNTALYFLFILNDTVFLLHHRHLSFYLTATFTYYVFR